MNRLFGINKDTNTDTNRRHIPNLHKRMDGCVFVAVAFNGNPNSVYLSVLPLHPAAVWILMWLVVYSGAYISQGHQHFDT